MFIHIRFSFHELLWLLLLYDIYNDTEHKGPRVVK